MTDASQGPLAAARTADAADSRDPTAAVEPCPFANKDWIEIELLGTDGQGVADQTYRVTAPDGSVRTGKLDARGVARLEHVAKGTCKVTFPDLDEEAWGS